MLSSWKKLKSKATGHTVTNNGNGGNIAKSSNSSESSLKLSDSVTPQGSAHSSFLPNKTAMVNTDNFDDESRKTITKNTNNELNNGDLKNYNNNNNNNNNRNLTLTQSATSTNSANTVTSNGNLNNQMESLNLGNGADNNVITAELDNNNPIQVVAPIPNPNPVATGPEKSVSSTSSATSKARPGLLTVKIYNGNNIRLPIPLKINKPVLSKLAQTGVGVDTETLENTIDQLLFVANNNNDYKKTDVGLLMTQSLPSLASIPTTNNYINNSPTTSTKKALLYLIVEFDNNTETIESSGSTIHSPKFNNVTTFDVSNSLNYLNVQVFARLPGMLIPEDDQSKSDDEFDQQQKVHQPNNSLQQDILIGNCKIPLSNKNLSNNEKGTRLINHEWVSIINPYSKLSMGFVNLTIDFKYLPKKSLTINDFDLLKVIGKGSFGKVMQVRKIDTGKIYALKSIRKTHIVSKMEVTHTLAEKFVLSKVDNPFIVPLKFAFQSPEKLYLVLAFINGGELFYHLQQSRRFSLVRAKFYISELLSAIECLHNLNIIYRDLKPENILLDYQGHIALCDFGLCKINMKLQEKTNTFCGTPEYLAPELLLGQGYTRVVDYWTLGTLLYEMLTGLPPFYDDDTSVMYKKILQDPLSFPSFLDSNTKSLIKNLLNRDPTKRLGYNGTQEIKSHPFFQDVDWTKLNQKGYIPPFKPPVQDLNDTSNFDSEFTSEKPADSVVDDFLSESVQKQFGGWTYVGSDTLGNSVIDGSFR